MVQYLIYMTSQENNQMVNHLDDNNTKRIIERFLLQKHCMRIARECKGTIFGGSIISYFKRKEGIIDFMNELDKTNRRSDFRKLLFDTTFQPSSFINRTTQIRDIGMVFDSQKDLYMYKNTVMSLPGVCEVILTNHVPYRSHIVFDNLFEVSKYKITYKYDYSFVEPSKGTTITIFIDIVIPKHHTIKIPCQILQYFSHKQLTWDKHGVHAPKMFKSDDFDASHTIINNFLKERVSLTKESQLMTNILSEIVSDIDSNDIIKKGETYIHIMISRAVFIIRVLVLMRLYDVYNSPLKSDTDKDCGICFEHKNDIMYKCTNNSTPYCLECLTLYIRNICDYKPMYNNPSDIQVEMLNILDDSDIHNLTKIQVYLIENILICPVGNKVDFSLKKI